MKHPDREDILEQTYDEMEAELGDKISGLKNQIHLTANKRNTIIQTDRIARNALELFDDLLNKEKLDKTDLALIIDRITVYEDRIEIKLKANIDTLLRSSTLDLVGQLEATGTDGETTARLNQDIAVSLQTRIVQSSRNQKDKIYNVNVVSEGDNALIYFGCVFTLELISSVFR